MLGVRPLAAFLGCLALGCGSATAQQTDQRLTSARTLFCEFAAGTGVDWEGGVPRATTRGPFGTTVIFDNINLRSGTARVIFGNTSNDVVAMYWPQGLSFLEGGAVLTTVFSNALPDGRLLAVQSRHFSVFTPNVSQYYGSCEIGGV